ncbi:hypothetical protein E2979_13920 [Paracoccus yeei]
MSARHHGSWLMAHGSWLMAHGSWLMAHGSWLMAHGSWLMAHGSWLMAHGSWLMAHGSWLRIGRALIHRDLPAKPPNILSPASAQPPSGSRVPHEARRQSGSP